MDCLLNTKCASSTSHGIRFHHRYVHSSWDQEVCERWLGLFTPAPRGWIFWLDPYCAYRYHCGYRSFRCRRSYLTVSQALVFYDINCERRWCAIPARLSKSCYSIHGHLRRSCCSYIQSHRGLQSCASSFRGPVAEVRFSYLSAVPISDYCHSHRGTTKPSCCSSWGTSHSSRSAPQETDLQLTARIHLSQYVSLFNITRTNLIFSPGQRRRTSMKCNPPSKNSVTNPEAPPVEQPVAMSEDSVSRRVPLHTTFSVGFLSLVFSISTCFPGIPLLPIFTFPDVLLCRLQVPVATKDYYYILLFRPLHSSVFSILNISVSPHHIANNATFRTT